MKAYSEDLRRKRSWTPQSGACPRPEGGPHLRGGISTVKRYATKAHRGELLKPGKAPGKRPKMGQKVSKLLEEDLKERPFVTLRERCD
jgi:transposase